MVSNAQSNKQRAQYIMHIAMIAMSSCLVNVWKPSFFSRHSDIAMRMYMVIKLAIKANMQLCDLAVISGLSPERSNGLNSRMHFHTIKSTYSASLWPTSMVTDSKLATCCRCCSHCLWGRMKMGRAWGLGILQRVQGFPAAKPAACKNILQFCGIA